MYSNSNLFEMILKSKIDPNSIIILKLSLYTKKKIIFDCILNYYKTKTIHNDINKLYIDILNEKDLKDHKELTEFEQLCKDYLSEMIII